MAASLPSWGSSARADTKIDLAIIVSGAVSLGAYQGGYLYALGEQLKTQGVRPALYVGASAGTINALLLGIDMCLPAEPDPEGSPLRTAWMDASLARLRGGGTTTSATAIFPQDGVRSIAKILPGLLSRKLDSHCDFVVVGETSRIYSRPLRVADHEMVPNIQEPFAIRITAREDGTARIHNFVPEDPQGSRALLPFPRDQEQPASRDAAAQRLIDFALASSAFPAAFPQVYLDHCMTDPDHPVTRPAGAADDGTECAGLKRVTTTPFADGGVLDNTPVGLAVETARGGWDAAQRQWHDPRVPDPKDDRPKGLSYLLVDTDNDAYDLPPSHRQAPATFLKFASTFGGSFLEAARGRALFDTLQQYPELHGHLIVSEHYSRLASAYLVAFFGFFDSRLRDFDFTGGMYDAARLIRSGRLASLLGGAADDAASTEAGVDAQLATELRGSTLAFRKLACLAQAFGPRLTAGAYDRCGVDAGAANEPQEPWQSLKAPSVDVDFESFVRLLQASIDEVYSQCECATLANRSIGPACSALLADASTGGHPLPPRLRTDFSLGDGWQQGCSANAKGVTVEDPFAYAVRRMAHYGFAGASVGDTNELVRDRIGTLGDDLVGRQPFWDKVASAFVGAPAIDSELGYRPASHSLYLVGGLGGVESGYSYGRWVRATGAVQVKLARDQGAAITPLVGLDWDLPFHSSEAQLHALLRAGFQFNNVGPNDVAYPCSGGFAGHAERCIMGQAGAALTLLELVRLQGVWEEDVGPFGKWTDHLLAEVGLQANWPLGPQ